MRKMNSFSISYLDEKIKRLRKRSTHAENFVNSIRVHVEFIEQQHKKICIYEELLEAEFVLIPAIRHLEQNLPQDARKDIVPQGDLLKNIFNVSDESEIPDGLQRKIISNLIDGLRTRGIHAQFFIDSEQDNKSIICSDAKKLSIYEELVLANLYLVASLKYIELNLPSDIVSGYNRHETDT